MNLEIRTRESKIQHKDNRLTGLIVPFDLPANVNEGGQTFTEIVRPGAFTRALNDGRPIWAIIKHNTTERMGQYPKGTLSLRETAEGLEGELLLPDSDYGKTIAWHVEKGNFIGWSFGFGMRTTKDKWTGRQRELLDVDLQEVTLTDNPVYQTSVSLREMASQAQIGSLNFYKALLKLRERE